MSKKKLKFKINKKIFIPRLIILILAIVVVSKSVGLAVDFFNIKPVDDELGYPVRGVDVSHYQGDVDWEVLASNDISFAFIKATEGSSHVDKNFKKNWEDSHKTDLKIGAYHFMSLETDGKKQAENFIKNVDHKRNMLPPVIDVELYGDFIKNPPSKKHFHSIMDPFIEEVEREYDMEPIIYCNTAMYEKIIEGEFDNPIWLADLSMPKELPDGKQWEFLQYSFEGKLKGYKGYLPHLDLNVYNGSRFSFAFNY